MVSFAVYVQRIKPTLSSEEEFKQLVIENHTRLSPFSNQWVSYDEFSPAFKELLAWYYPEFWSKPRIDRLQNIAKATCIPSIFESFLVDYHNNRLVYPELQIARSARYLPVHSEPSRGLTYRLHECAQASDIEYSWSKTFIVEAIFNHQFYGFRTYGLNMVSQVYFGKPPSELSMPQSALIHALMHRPTHFAIKKEAWLQKTCQELEHASIPDVQSICEQIPELIDTGYAHRDLFFMFHALSQNFHRIFRPLKS